MNISENLKKHFPLFIKYNKEHIENIKNKIIAIMINAYEENEEKILQYKEEYNQFILDFDLDDSEIDEYINSTGESISEIIINHEIVELNPIQYDIEETFSSLQSINLNIPTTYYLTYDNILKIEKYMYENIDTKNYNTYKDVDDKKNMYENIDTKNYNTYKDVDVKNDDTFENIDKFVIDERTRLYDELRKNTFMKFYNNLDNDMVLRKDNISNQYDNGSLEILYNINKSITQSLRSTTGNNFENIISIVFDLYNIPYSRQVFIDDNGILHKAKNKNMKGSKVDFVVPKINETHYGQHIQNKYIISCKTSLRERYLQDSFLSDLNLYTITMDNTDDDSFISICEHAKKLTKFIIDLKKKLINIVNKYE